MLKAAMCWSGGKDSALALYLAKSAGYNVLALITTLEAQSKKVSMHGYAEHLLDIQAQSINLPLLKVYISESSNNGYEQKMNSALQNLKKQGIENIIFGDIFLKDLREYREKLCLEQGMKAIFPLWNMNSHAIAKKVFQLKFKAILCCVSGKYFNEDDAGKEYSPSFVAALPLGVDVCGENGEFHTFCYDGPIFNKSIEFKKGKKYLRTMLISRSTRQEESFWYCEL